MSHQFRVCGLWNNTTRDRNHIIGRLGCGPTPSTSPNTSKSIHWLINRKCRIMLIVLERFDTVRGIGILFLTDVVVGQAHSTLPSTSKLEWPDKFQISSRNSPEWIQTFLLVNLDLGSWHFFGRKTRSLFFISE